MHLPDTILLDKPAGVALTAAGAAVAAAGMLWGSRRMSAAETGRAGMLSAFVFVASAVHVPLPLASTHLGLYGLAGVLLGRRVLLIAPIAFGLQAVLFGHGGLAAIGLNACNMAAGALLARAWFRRLGADRPAAAPRRIGAGAFGAGFLGILVMAGLVLAELLLLGYPPEIAIAVPIWIGTAILEGVVTVVVLGTLVRFYPELLTVPPPSDGASREDNHA
ncbi:MAG: energy-coupling factor ABC transporter permease [Planctomycetes bacterium]|nr:energy-coupling factor ABC transporter permease [Planctomycetota bacterium]